MNTYKLHITYDGTNYSGWQIQPNSLSIQQLVQNAVRILVREDVNVIGSGRTDAGVHALDQVAHFRSSGEHNPEQLFKALNGMLPKDIRVKCVESAPNTFHAQRSAKSKEYHYRLSLGPYVSPFERQYVWHVPYKIDRTLLQEAASLFIGTHDFFSFANSGHMGAAAKNSVRTMMRLDIVEQDGLLVLVFEADGFLYKMVRNIVGMLINVASKKLPLSDIPVIFAAKDRRRAPMSAPPQGLFLVKVKY
jgi:tRNA pseudouridine38-40 synthase